MDGSRFDGLTKSFAKGTGTRRKLLSGLIATGLGGAVLASDAIDVEAKKGGPCGRKKKKCGYGCCPKKKYYCCIVYGDYRCCKKRKYR